MKCQIPQISWHGRDPVLSVDFQLIKGEVRRLATGGTDSHVVIWYVTLCPKNTISIECACDIVRHNKSVNVVRFSPNGEFLASGDDEGAIFIWKLKEKNQPDLDFEEGEANKENWAPFKLLRTHLDDVCDLNWSPSSEFLVSGSVDNSVVVWDVQKGLCVHVAKEAKGFVQGVAWDPLNSYFVSISSDRFLRFYKVASRKVACRVHRAPSSETSEKGITKLFHDDTLQSFSRRLNFSPDGELLFVPSGIKEKDEKSIHTTYAFSRYNPSQPVFHFPTGQKYSVAVRCCPTLFKLHESKNELSKPLIKLPYRILIAVATQDEVFFYDTQQSVPFAHVSNIHYTHLTDLAWSSDGRMLVVSSTDGYCSFIIFNEGELGEVYVEESKEDVENITPKNEDLTSDPKSELSTPTRPTESTLQKVDGLETIKSPRKSSTPKKAVPIVARRLSPHLLKRCPKNITSFLTPPAKKTTDDSNGEMAKNLDKKQEEC